MKKILIFILVVIPYIVSCQQSGSGQNRAASGEQGEMGIRNTEKGADESFVKEAASGGLMEVELGKFAQQNAQNPRVKQFGAMMVRDHSKANEELKGIAATKNIDVPAQLDDTHRRKLEDLQGKSGDEFDEAYIKDMVDDHEKDVSKFRKQAEDGQDPELKAFAAKTLPILIMHQDSAKSIRDAISK